MLNPNFLPPIPGTQSGTSNFTLFNPLIKKFIPSMTIFNKPIIPFNGALAIAVRELNIPEKTFLTPSQANDQSPVKTPFTKSITPESAVLIALYQFAKFATNAFTILPIAPKN